MKHFLQPPFGLTAGREQRLVSYLQDEDFASAITLLRDSVSAQTDSPQLLVLLAYARFEDALNLASVELAEASREALQLLHRAMQLGARHEDVAPLLGRVEDTLDSASRHEEALRQQWAQQSPDALSLESLEQLVELFERSDVAQAKAVQLLLVKRLEASPLFDVALARLALLEFQCNGFGAAKAALEKALQLDWTVSERARNRLTLEEVETVLLEHATGDEFNAVWALSSERGRALDFEFPRAWPHQERLFARCVALGDNVKARALADRIEDERSELSERLSEAFRRVRLRAVSSV
jgi:hypothetical protein